MHEGAKVLVLFYQSLTNWWTVAVLIKRLPPTLSNLILKNSALISLVRITDSVLQQGDKISLFVPNYDQSINISTGNQLPFEMKTQKD